MANITKIKCLPIQSATDSEMLPLRIEYKQNGIEKYWDTVKRDNSVQIIVFDANKKSLIALKGFRIGTYCSSIPQYQLLGEIDLEKYPVHLGMSLELCNGKITETVCLKKYARETVLSKCKYNVQQENLQQIINFRDGIGIGSAKTSLFYCTVTEDDHVQTCCTQEDAFEIVEFTIPQIKSMLSNHSILVCSCEFLFALQWILYNFEHNKLKVSKK